MKTATFVRDLGFSGSGALQSLYTMDPPLGGHELVVVSAVVVSGSGPETYIFAADATGKVTGWVELDGSFRGALDHRQALCNAGYTVNAPAPLTVDEALARPTEVDDLRAQLAACRLERDALLGAAIDAVEAYDNADSAHEVDDAHNALRVVVDRLAPRVTP